MSKPVPAMSPWALPGSGKALLLSFFMSMIKDSPTRDSTLFRRRYFLASLAALSLGLRTFGGAIVSSELDQCTRNLHTLFDAIQVYRQSRHALPDHLADVI